MQNKITGANADGPRQSPIRPRWSRPHRSVVTFGMRPILCAMGVILAMLSYGCRRPPAAVLARALASTNVVFQTYAGESVVLSEAGSGTVKKIVPRFSDSSRVEARKEILPAF